MRSSRAILSIQYTAASAKTGKAVGGFLRYVHYRDHQNPDRDSRGVTGLVRYVAYRDSASPQGRLFDRQRTVGDRERLKLLGYVRRSIERVPDGRLNQRAVYRLVLSPEDARGLDLRRLARTTMAQLERDLGHRLPPWIAAEHRNTNHPHVHVVLAARREVSPGRFREIRVTRERLARMKSALGREIERQRQQRPRKRSLEQQLLAAPRRQRMTTRRARPPSADRLLSGLAIDLGRALRRAADKYRRDLEEEYERHMRERELDEERERSRGR